MKQRNAKNKIISLILTLVMLCSLVAQAVPMSVIAAESTEQATVTIKMGDGYRSEDGEGWVQTDLVLTVDKGDIALTHEWVQNAFGGNSPTTNADGTVDYTKLLFAFTDGEGKEYRSGDTLPVTGDVTLTCVFGNNMQYANNGTSSVKLTAIWPTDVKDYSDDNAKQYYKENYTARDFQPLYYPLTAIDANFGQHLNTVVRTIEFPNTVTYVNGLNETRYAMAVTGLENVTQVYDWGMRHIGISAGSYATSIRYTFESITSLGGESLSGWAPNGVTARFVFGGTTVADDKIHEILNRTSRNHQNKFDDRLKDANLIVYVPYGQTSLWYPNDEEYTTNALTSFNITAEGATGGQHGNVPMREAYRVTFDLNGGYIADEYNGVYHYTYKIPNTYMDAGAKSVKRVLPGSESGTKVEVNMFENATEAGAFTVNHSRQDLSLLGAEQPENPVKAGKAFAGWKDENGRIWTDEDWKNGGVGNADKNGDGVVALTAVWTDICNVTINPGVGYVYVDGAWTTDKTFTFVEHAGEVVLTHDLIQEIFGGHSPTTKESGEVDYDNLLFGLFVDGNGNGTLDDGEALYQSGDVLNLTGDIELTCYFKSGYQYEPNTVSGIAGVGLVAVWTTSYKDNDTAVTISGTNSNAQTLVQTNKYLTGYAFQESYTARDLQPLYYPMTIAYNYAFGGYTANAGNWITKHVEFPTTVLEINQSVRELVNLETLTGLDNVTTIVTQGLRQAFIYGNAKNNGVRLTFNNIKDIKERGLYYNTAFNGRYIFAGHADTVADSAANTIFALHNSTCIEGYASVTTNEYNVVVYVPYGETALWFATETNVNNAQSIFSATASHINVPMREAYEVTFDLNGGEGSIKPTYMDAGAASVKYGGVEYNVSEATTYDSASGDGLAINTAAQKLDLLPAEQPATPTYAGHAFAGWKDENGHIWTDEDWKNGGVGNADKNGDGVVALTAVWAEICNVTINPGVGYMYIDGKWTTDAEISFVEPAGEVVLSNTWVRNTFGDNSPTTNKDGSVNYNALLFGLFVDENGNELLDDGETLYCADDVINFAGNLELTCYFNDKLQFAKYNAGVQLTKSYSASVEGADANAKDQNAQNNGLFKEVYTARDLQPFYYELLSLGVTGCFGRQYNTTTTTIILPDSVETAYNGSLQNMSKLKYVGVENMKNFHSYSLTNFGTAYKDGTELRLTFANIAKLRQYPFSKQYANGEVVRFLFAGHDASVAEADVNKILTYDRLSNSNSSAISDMFYGPKANDGHGASNDYETPTAYVYVPYGQTLLWYPSEADYMTAETSFSTKWYEGTNAAATAGTYSFTKGTDESKTYIFQHANMPMREMYAVTFNLGGGVGEAKTTYMDAGAGSVIYGGVERNAYNEAVYGEDGNGLYVKNPSAQNLKLLGAQKPADPTREGYTFAGWKDQFGYTWTEVDWANGGHAGVDYGTEGAVLTATWLGVDGASLSLGTDISILLAVNTDSLSGYAYNKVTVTFDGKPYVLDGYTDSNIVSGFTLYRFDNINPAQINEKLSAVLSVSNDGETWTDAPAFEYSVLDYCTNMYNKETVSAELKTAIVDLVNYGAAAMQYLDADADVSFTESFASSTTVIEGLNPVLGGHKGEFIWTGASLDLSNSVKFNFYVSGELGANVPTVTIGGTAVECTVSEIGNNEYVITTGHIDVSDLDEVITVTLGDSYVNYNIAKYYSKMNSEANIGGLVTAMMKYIISANAYVDAAQ